MQHMENCCILCDLHKTTCVITASKGWKNKWTYAGSSGLDYWEEMHLQI